MARNAVTPEIWDQVTEAYRKFGVHHARVARAVGRATDTVTRYYKNGFPPAFPPIKDILAEGYVRPPPAAPPPLSRNAPQNDALYNAPIKPEHDASNTVQDASEPVHAASVRVRSVGMDPDKMGDAAREAHALVLSPTELAHREQEKVMVKAMQMHPKLVSAEIDGLALSHELNRSMVGTLLRLWRALEPSLRQVADRMEAKVLKGECSEREARRWLVAITQRAQVMSKLTEATIQQTRLMFGQPTAITEHRTAGEGTAPPTADIFAEMRARIEKLKAAEGSPESIDVAQFEAGGDDETDTDDA